MKTVQSADSVEYLDFHPGKKTFVILTPFVLVRSLSLQVQNEENGTRVYQLLGTIPGSILCCKDRQEDLRYRKGCDGFLKCSGSPHRFRE